MTYTVIFEQGPTSWGAYVPDLPGCIAVGDTREDVETEIQAAIKFHLDGLRETRQDIPPAPSFAGTFEVSPAA